MSRSVTLILIALVAAALVAWVAYLQRGAEAPAPVGEPAPVAVPEPAPEPAPEPPRVDPPPPPPPDAPPLPALDASDEQVLAALRERAGPGLAERLLVPEALLRKLVATVDNLPRQSVSMKVRALQAAPRRFLVTGEGDELYLDPANYARYRAHRQVLDALSPEAAADLYVRFYPLLQQAYRELGYPDDEFHSRAALAIEQLLATPDVRGPVRLTRPHVLYEFADPQLEALGAGQKMLLRAGPENAARAKAWLRAFRAALAERTAGAAPRREDAGGG